MSHRTSLVRVWVQGSSSSPFWSAGKCSPCRPAVLGLAASSWWGGGCHTSYSASLSFSFLECEVGVVPTSQGGWWGAEAVKEQRPEHLPLQCLVHRRLLLGGGGLTTHGCLNTRRRMRMQVCRGHLPSTAVPPSALPRLQPLHLLPAPQPPAAGGGDSLPPFPWSHDLPSPPLPERESGAPRHHHCPVLLARVLTPPRPGQALMPSLSSEAPQAQARGPATPTASVWPPSRESI